MAAAFSLAGLLRLRSLREADAAGRLFTAHEKTQRANQRLEKFRVQAAQSEAPQGPPESLLAVAAARSSSRSMLDELRAYAEQASSDQQQAEWDYRSARQDVKVVEKLQARHDQRLAHERLAAEQAALDEAGQQRSLREEGALMTFSSAMGRIGQIESAIGAYSPQAPPPGAAQNVPRSGEPPALAASEARAVSAEPGTALRGPQPLSGPASDFEALMRVLSYAEELGAGPRSSAPRDASSSVPGASPASSASSATPAGSASSGDGSGRDIVAAAQKHHGVPYLWGGTDPSRGLDCSGLVKNVMAEFGISVPRVAAAQARVGKEVPSLEQAKPGDLIVTRGGGHIGIYAGSGEWTHAPRPGRSVVTEPVSGTIMTIRRMVDSPQEASAAPAAQTASADRGAFEARMAGART